MHTIKNPELFGNPEALYIYETTRFLPWGGKEPTQFYVARTSEYYGKPLHGEPVSGPYPDIEQARAVLDKLQHVSPTYRLGTYHQEDDTNPVYAVLTVKTLDGTDYTIGAVGFHERADAEAHLTQCLAESRH
jgi:hypothetical protein